jgi:hypothetical protein
MPIEVDALIVAFSQRFVLVYGPDAAALGQPMFGPPVYIHPGFKLVAQNEYLLPDEAIDDRGQHFYGPEAVDWIETRGGGFPRADAIGELASGGRISLRLKELDLAVLVLFASARPDGPRLRLELAIEAQAVPDGYALVPSPVPAPLQPYARALRSYRLAPGVFGAVGSGIVQRLLSTHQADWRLTYDDVDNAIDG